MNQHSTYLVTFPYTVEFTLPKDGHITKVTIETQSQTVRFGQSEDDVEGQMSLDHHYGKSTYAKHLIDFSFDQLIHIDPKATEVRYGEGMQIETMTEQEILEFKEECLSNG
jgi:hypothetical protein